MAGGNRLAAAVVLGVTGQLADVAGSSRSFK